MILSLASQCGQLTIQWGTNSGGQNPTRLSLLPINQPPLLFDIPSGSDGSFVVPNLALRDGAQFSALLEDANGQLIDGPAGLTTVASSSSSDCINASPPRPPRFVTVRGRPEQCASITIASSLGVQNPDTATTAQTTIRAVFPLRTANAIQTIDPSKPWRVDARAGEQFLLYMSSLPNSDGSENSQPLALSSRLFTVAQSRTNDETCLTSLSAIPSLAIIPSPDDFPTASVTTGTILPSPFPTDDTRPPLPISPSDPQGTATSASHLSVKIGAALGGIALVSFVVILILIIRRKKAQAQRRQHTIFELDPTVSNGTTTHPFRLVSTSKGGGNSERPSMTSFRPSVKSFRPSTADTTDMIHMKPLSHATSPPRHSYPLPHLHSPPHHQHHHQNSYQSQQSQQSHRDDDRAHHYRDHHPSPLVLSESVSSETSAISSSYQAQPQQPQPPQTGSTGTSTPSTSSVSPPGASQVFRRQRNQRPSLDPIETSAAFPSVLAALSAASSRERDSPMSATSPSAPRPGIGRVMTTPSISVALAGLGKVRGHARTSSQAQSKPSPPPKTDSPKLNDHLTLNEVDTSPPLQPWLRRPKSTTSVRPMSTASTVRPPSVSSVASSSAPRAIEEGEWDYAPQSPLFFVCPEEDARKGATAVATAEHAGVDGLGKG